MHTKGDSHLGFSTEVHDRQEAAKMARKAEILMPLYDALSLLVDMEKRLREAIAKAEGKS
jgi:hypothetical protein